MTEETKHLYCIRRSALVDLYITDIDRLVEKRRVLKETPKGFRVWVSYQDNGTVYTHDKYYFFTTYEAACTHLAERVRRKLESLFKQIDRFEQMEGKLMDITRKTPV
ncbi:hypothetical protein [Citrobacter werkmanii]|uniref:hypothetical protein n=1 Tax=Citrobacter werkmanii TaxID=67827 RepID=UPI0037CB251D